MTTDETNVRSKEAELRLESLRREIVSLRDELAAVEEAVEDAALDASSGIAYDEAHFSAIVAELRRASGGTPRRATRRHV